MKDRAGETTGEKDEIPKKITIDLAGDNSPRMHVGNAPFSGRID